MVIVSWQWHFNNKESPPSKTYRCLTSEMFSTYKVNDADAGTNSGVDVTIVGGVKMYIRWLFLWVAYQEDNRAMDPNWNNWSVWTHEEFVIFKLAY